MQTNYSSETEVIQDSKKMPRHASFSETFSLPNTLGYFRGFLAIAGPRHVHICGQMDKMERHY